MNHLSPLYVELPASVVNFCLNKQADDQLKIFEHVELVWETNSTLLLTIQQKVGEERTIPIVALGPGGNNRL